MAEETERVAVSTYVPAYQREEWREHAERLDMSQSEFVRTMVQAGRRGFDLGESGGAKKPVEPPQADVTPGVDGLETRIETLLRDRGPLEWGELVGALTDDIEDEVEAALSELQGKNRIQHSGRRGGYTVVEGSDGE